ncbi:MAG: glutamate-1-semialdehyde 2,1-aminomutase [Spirochaetaceae bacterium]|jgi:glutamate-1-semialdehyde 2,1-aminomutase|nr:glutamate-1-semialdehyde 2,1-aminomutase [Spirochaetaceae bacterium]
MVTGQNLARSQALYARAKERIPGGVNSPVRAFRGVGLDPLFMERGEGPFIYDVDGNRYIDFVGSWGPLLLGHNHPVIRAAVLAAAEQGLSFGAATEAEVRMAELMTSLVPSLEMVRMVNSGTEATMSALRAARGFTGRDKILKFAGCYHGHSDALLVKAGSGLLSESRPDSAGVSAACAADTLVAPFNDAIRVEELFARHHREIAAVILEPIPANMGVVLPEEGFLAHLRDLCSASGTLLIFDEVITGFRLGLSGAQGRCGVKPDLSAFGKIIGGGMPVGAYGGKREVMELISPLGPVYQAGTLSGNPVAMAAGLAQLEFLASHPEVYNTVDRLGDMLFTGLKDILHRTGASCTVNHIGSMGSLFFTNETVRDLESAKTADTGRYAAYFTYLLRGGIYQAPAQFEALFVSFAHTEALIQQTLESAEDFFRTFC